MLINNKKGIGLPVVIGIITFVLSLATTVFTVAVNQAVLVKKSAEYTENYANNAHTINSAISIIENDPSILDDAQKRTDLSNLLHITLTQPLGETYWQVSNVNSQPQLISFFEFFDEGTSVSDYLYDLLQSPLLAGLNTNDNKILNDNIQVQAATTFYNAFISFYNINPIITTTYDEIVTHANENRLSSNRRIATNIDDLRPADGVRVVVLGSGVSFGNRSNINDILIVRGNLAFGNQNIINGAFYSSGVISQRNNVSYATIKPTFFFANQILLTSNNITTTPHHLYTFSNELSVARNTGISGAYFVKNTFSDTLSLQFIPINQTLTLANGVSNNLFINLTGVGSGGGEGSFIYTRPRLIP